MIEDFFDHKCNIFHVVKGTGSPGFGLPGSPTFEYSPVPDIAEQDCHFGVRNGTLNTAQQQPQNDLNARLKLTLPAGTDIRMNDKVVDCKTGLSYTAEVPRDIRGHHTIVYIKREGPGKAL